MSKSNTKKRFSLWMPKGYDVAIHVAIIVLVLFGVVMVGSAAMGLAVGNNTYLLVTVAKQILFGVFGYIAMTYLANHFKISFLRSTSFPIVIFITVGLLLSCLLFDAQFGSKAWISLSAFGQSITIQPSEFAKITTILIVAAYCGDVKKEFKSAKDLLLRPVLFSGIMILIVMLLQKDFGSAVVIFLITCVVLLIPNNALMRKFQVVLKVLFWVTLAGVIYILSPAGESFINSLPLKDYQKDRFLSALNPFEDKYGRGYQLVNGLVSFATGGWFGTGFGTSIRKYTNFPAAHNDFILAILVEELGFVGFLFLMLLYGVIIFRLLHFASIIKSEKAKIILIGTAMYLLIHMVFNIGGVTGLLPLTGVPLLVISAGGSSTMSFMACIGLSQAVISQYRKKEIA